MQRVRVFATCLCFLAADARDGLSLEYQKWRDTDEIIRHLYLQAAAEGVNYANASIEPTSARLFCVPANLALTMKQYEQILETFVKRYLGSENRDMELLLVAALRETFPCRTTE